MGKLFVLDQLSLVSTIRLTFEISVFLPNTVLLGSRCLEADSTAEHFFSDAPRGRLVCFCKHKTYQPLTSQRQPNKINWLTLEGEGICVQGAVN